MYMHNTHTLAYMCLHLKKDMCHIVCQSKRSLENLTFSVLVCCRHWLARPSKYKKSIVFADDCVYSSTLVQTAIDANSGNVKPEVSITFQGTPTHGFYEWVNFTAVGGAEAYSCNTVDVAVTTVSSKEFGLKKQIVRLASDPFEVTFIDGEFPTDTEVVVHVGSADTVEPIEVYRGNIYDMIQSSSDVYIRGTDLDAVSGFAYTSLSSDAHAVFGPSCDAAPQSDDVQFFEW